MQWTDRIGRRIKLRDLHVLLAVAEHGNMAKAADALSISRPVVSETIADLERALGVRLLDRDPQGIEPTLFGRALLKTGVVIFDELRQGIRELEFLADSRAGELRIGCSEPVAAGILPAIIDRLSQRYPRLDFQLVVGDATTLQVRDLRERKIEVALGQMRSATPEPDMEAEFLFYQRLCVVAGKRSKWAKRRKIALADLLDAQWILAPLEMSADSPIVEAFRKNGLEIPPVKVLGYSLPLRNSLLATGRFVTVVPDSVIRFGAERLLLQPLPIELPRWRLPVAIITVKNRTLSPPAKLFIECAREVAKPLAK